MKLPFLKPLAITALLVVGVSCGKDRSDSPKPCVRDCFNDLQKMEPERKKKNTPADEKASPARLQRKDDDAERRRLENGTTKPKEDKVYSDTTYVEALADACKDAGGTFAAESIDCACPGADVGAVYSAKSNACVIPARDMSCTKTGETFTAALERRGTEDFIASCLSKIQTFEGTITSIEIPNDRPTRAREVAKLLDSQPATRPLRGSVPALFSRPGWDSFFVVIYGASNFDKRVLSAKPYGWDPNGHTFADEKPAVHIPTEAGLSALFQHDSATRRREPVLPSLDVFSKEDKEALRPLMNALSGHLGSAHQSTYAPELRGCTQLCNVRTELVTLLDGRNIWRDRTYVWGQLFSEEIILGKDETSIDARLVLGAAGALSAIEVHTHALKGSTLKTAQKTFDAQGKLLAEEQKKDVDLTTLSSLHATHGLASIGTDTPVVVCNSFFFTGEENKPFSENILFGPHALSDPFGKGSLFGWEENEAASVGRFLGGLKQDLSLLKQDGFSHAFSSPLANSAGGRLRIIPATSARCTPGSSFLKSVQAKTREKARIVASLTSTYENANDCRVKYGKALEEGTHLWVVTSGGTGLPGRDNFRCPQALGPSENLIVVGGDLTDGQLTGGRSVSPPDSGEDYLDLVVVSINQRHAPALAASAAATIQAIHGDVLSNSLIRMALLLSVDLPKSRGAWAPYPARSGGFLNPKRALEAATFIATQLSPAQRARFGASEANAVIEHLFTDMAEAQYRMKLVSERKGLLL
jgi:hypothetical protein